MRPGAHDSRGSHPFPRSPPASRTRAPQSLEGPRSEHECGSYQTPWLKKGHTSRFSHLQEVSGGPEWSETETCGFQGLTATGDQIFLGQAKSDGAVQRKNFVKTNDTPRTVRCLVSVQISDFSRKWRVKVSSWGDTEGWRMDSNITNEKQNWSLAKIYPHRCNHLRCRMSICWPIFFSLLDTSIRIITTVIMVCIMICSNSNLNLPSLLFTRDCDGSPWRSETRRQRQTKWDYSSLYL